MCPALTRACLPSAATPRRPRNPQEALDCCARIGYPCMLKASWGGGGKGIRKVRAGQQGRAGGLGWRVCRWPAPLQAASWAPRLPTASRLPRSHIRPPSHAPHQVMSDDDVRAVFQQVQGEVPGSPIFAMKLAPQSRHLEVQLLADRCAGGRGGRARRGRAAAGVEAPGLRPRPRWRPAPAGLQAPRPLRPPTHNPPPLVARAATATWPRCSAATARCSAGTRRLWRRGP